MKTVTIILTLFLAGMGLAVAAQDSATVPQLIVFEKTGFGGEHGHFFTGVPDLTNFDGKFWDDQISSIAVISGNWTFFADPVGAGAAVNPSVTLGPGIYPDVTRERIPDNSVSQIRLEP
jgi:hypothetical protein